MLKPVMEADLVETGTQWAYDSIIAQGELWTSGQETAECMQVSRDQSLSFDLVAFEPYHNNTFKWRSSE